MSVTTEIRMAGFAKMIQMPEGSLVSISDEEWERRIRRRSLLLAVALWIVLSCAAVSIVYWTVQLVALFCGDNSWPSGVFIGLLVLYSISVYWRYRHPSKTDDDD